MKLAIAITLLLALTQTSAKSNLIRAEKQELKKECIVDNCLESLGEDEGDCGFCMGNCLEQVIVQKQGKIDGRGGKSKRGGKSNGGACFKDCKDACDQVARGDWADFKVCKKDCWRN